MSMVPVAEYQHGGNSRWATELARRGREELTYPFTCEAAQPNKARSNLGHPRRRIRSGVLQKNKFA